MAKNKKHQKTIAIDFDGVLADYSNGWQGDDVFGEVVDGASAATEVLKNDGWRIIIFTTRKVSDKLKEWLKDNKISYDYINENPDQPESASGKVIADIYLDDRAVTFRGDWKWTVRDIAGFTPYERNKEDIAKEIKDNYDEEKKWAKKYNPFVLEDSNG